jgi:hypothetical protein
MDSGLARSLSSGAHSRDPVARPGMTKKLDSSIAAQAS